MSFIDGNKNGLSIETINKPFETQAFRGNEYSEYKLKGILLNWTLN